MQNHSHGRGRPVRSVAAKQSGTPAFTEPEVRRWPHPVDGDSNNRQSNSSGQTNTALYYIHCALSYQNQLLADIKALLEQLTAEGIPAQEEK